jgi:hypothetical protein
MPTSKNLLQAWQDANDALVMNLAAATGIMNGDDYSDDPASPYQRARAEIRMIQGELNRLALAGLSQIDDTIASGTLVQDLSGLSKKAKDEAASINNAAATLEDVAKAVDTVAGVVTQIAGLPFL